MIRAVAWSVLISGTTLIALAAAVLLANVGAPLFWFTLLFLVPLTVGLPSTCGLLLVTALWNGPPLWAYAILAFVTAFVIQLACINAWYHWRRGRRP